MPASMDFFRNRAVVLFAWGKDTGAYWHILAHTCKYIHMPELFQPSGSHFWCTKTPKIWPRFLHVSRAGVLHTAAWRACWPSLRLPGWSWRKLCLCRDRGRRPCWNFMNPIINVCFQLMQNIISKAGVHIYYQYAESGPCTILHIGFGAWILFYIYMQYNMQNNSARSMFC